MTWVLSLRSDLLTDFFKLFPYLTGTTFYMSAIALGYWMSRKGFFKHLAVLVCLSTLISWGLKEFFALPRPLISRLIEIDNSYGFPSADVQVALIFWLAFAHALKSRILCGISIFLVMLIGFSRMYLGVHSLLDVIGGAVFAVLILYIYENLQKNEKISKFLLSSKFIYLAELGVLVLYFYVMRQSLHPVVLNAGGFLVGVLSSFYLDSQTIKRMEGSLLKQIVFGFLNLALLFVLKAGMKTFLSATPLTVFIIAAFLGFYVMIGALFLNHYLRAVFKPAAKSS